MEKQIDELVEVALQEAKEKHGEKFVDGHQGVAVLYEEYLEVVREVKPLGEQVEQLFKSVVMRDRTNCKDMIDNMKYTTRQIALEAIQCAAVVEKLEEYYKQFVNYDIKLKR